MRFLTIGSLLTAAALAFTPARAQQPPSPDQHQNDATSQQQHGQQPSATPDEHNMMANMKMMADMKAADAKFQELSAKMKSARGDSKIRAIEDVVDALVKSQIDMHQTWG